MATAKASDLNFSKKSEKAHGIVGYHCSACLQAFRSEEDCYSIGGANAIRKQIKKDNPDMRVTSYMHARCKKRIEDGERWPFGRFSNEVPRDWRERLQIDSKFYELGRS